MFLVAFALSQSTAPIAVYVREPKPATPWTETTAGTCGKDRLVVTRPLYPLGGKASLHINGQPVRGDLVKVENELSNVRAAYRISIECGQGGGPIYLRWVRGQSDGNGNISYRSGQVTVASGALTESVSEDSNAETFWFR